MKPFLSFTPHTAPHSSSGIFRTLGLRFKAAGFLALTTALMVSCASHTPQTRAERYPEIFNSISPQHQELAQRGELKQGMSKAAVFIAKGKPSRRLSGEKNGRSFDRWDYRALQPVVSHRFGGYFGHGFGRYGCRRYGYGYGPQIDYVSVPSAFVRFENNRVKEWQYLDRH